MTPKSVTLEQKEHRLWVIREIFDFVSLPGSTATLRSQEPTLTTDENTKTRQGRRHRRDPGRGVKSTSRTSNLEPAGR
jgi:hypothetical protein